MNNKLLWWFLLVLQVFLYGIHTPLQNWSHYEIVFFGAFTLSLGAAVALLYAYRCQKKRILVNKQKSISFFVITVLSIGLIGYVTYFGFYLFFPIFYLSLVLFIIILVITGKIFVFIPKSK